MAARIQADINAPCKEKKRIPSVTVEHVEQQSPEPALRPRPQRPELVQQKELPPPCLEQRTKVSAAMVKAKPKTHSRRSQSRARSDNSHGSDGNFSFTNFMHEGSDSEAGFPRSKRPRVDIPERRSYTRCPQHTTKVTSTVGADLQSETSTNITIPDIGNNINNNNNTNVEQGSLSETDQMKQMLKLNLLRLLNNELDYAGIRDNVIPLTKQLYEISSHRVPFSKFEFEFKISNEHWTIGKALLTRSRLLLASHNRSLRILSQSWRKKTFLKNAWLCFVI